MTYALLLASAILGADDQTRTEERRPIASQHIDGTWQVVCVESGGKPLATAKENTSVTIKNNTIAFSGNGLKEQRPELQRPGSKDGRPGMWLQQSWRLEFGPNQTVRATPVSGTGEGDRSRQERNRQEKSDPSQGRQKIAQEGTQSGVYVLSREYLCLSLHANGSPGQTATIETGRPEQTARQIGRAEDPSRAATRGNSAADQFSGSFIVILRRSDGERQPRPER
jgi:hypothetical protein